ncbi:MAG: helix-turn-helix domain-containing protein [Herbiconiux sp.]|nr:helix-turn-helix domain-containing protein [Herbiconiux sp.]
MSEPGLRERKKRESARAIERAAVELAAEGSLAELTIEAISARADVTSRTFFNYYASKEDAVLGNSRAFPPAAFEHLERRPGVPVLDTLIGAISDELSRFDFGTREFIARKRAVLLENPQLLLKDFQSLGSLEERLVAVVRRLLDDEAAADGAPEAESGAGSASEAASGADVAHHRDDRAWAVVYLAGSILRLAMHTWSHDDDPGRPVAEHIRWAQSTITALNAPATPASAPAPDPKPAPNRGTHVVHP